jgi:hypothetical protein
VQEGASSSPLPSWNRTFLYSLMIPTFLPMTKKQDLITILKWTLKLPLLL